MDFLGRKFQNFHLGAVLYRFFSPLYGVLSAMLPESAYASQNSFVELWDKSF